MIFRTSVLALAVGATLAGPVLAQQQSEVLFSHKHWQVELVAWNDGGLGCMAQVSSPGESFSVWTFQDGTVELQFYSTAWDFGEGDTANLQVQIDKMAPWTLTNAELYRNSVLFDLPKGGDGADFIIEVAKGNRLFLRSEDGSDVQNYSLSGSSASIEALLECGTVIMGDTPKNPFN